MRGLALLMAKFAKAVVSWPRGCNMWVGFIIPRTFPVPHYIFRKILGYLTLPVELQSQTQLRGTLDGNSQPLGLQPKALVLLKDL